MIPIARLKTSFPRVAGLVEPHLDLLRKAVSFALIGFLNVLVDASVFFLVYPYLISQDAALHLFDALARGCASAAPALPCPGGETLGLGTANVMSWAVAVSGSYLMNSFFTFAAESGRQFRWRDYRKFVASGILGVIASTATLLAAAHVMPVPAAKGCAILAGFAVNFSMSHFVVFRPRASAGDSGVVATD
ncbi:MAG: GtrA family protein [Bradyrhizobiaceae bacterium]|nr:GtrA family protein [Bradyrhizobiaceae bacterium]